jgi:hypothetical protein
MADVMWIGMELWRLDLFEVMAPFMPPVVRWDYAVDGNAWRSRWVVFNYHPAHLIYENWDGFEYRSCVKCGQRYNRGMVEARASLWLSRKDIVWPVSKAILIGTYVTDDVKRLPAWKLAGRVKFRKVEVRNL